MSFSVIRATAIGETKTGPHVRISPMRVHKEITRWKFSISEDLAKEAGIHPHGPNKKVRVHIDESGERVWLEFRSATAPYQLKVQTQKTQACSTVFLHKRHLSPKAASLMSRWANRVVPHDLKPLPNPNMGCDIFLEMSNDALEAS